MINEFGPIVLIGSGETSLAGGRIFETIAREFPQPLRIAIMETPAGFESNSTKVAGRVGDFLKNHLQKFKPLITIIPARKRGTHFGTDDPEILQPLIRADLIFMGPGSPTYAVRQFKGSLAWDLVRARHRMGAALALASAAAIAVGDWTLPVYEIYKVGEDVSIGPGLKLFSDFNLPLSIIPHWNNTAGGDEVDTSRCFIGIERFNQWCRLLPSGYTTIGLDEHTGIIIDFSTGKCFVRGVSSVTLQRGTISEVFSAGMEFPLSKLGEFQPPAKFGTGISARAMEMVKYGKDPFALDEAPFEVTQLVEKRELARCNRKWAEADILRKRIADLGWSVQDTPEGQKIIRHS